MIFPISLDRARIRYAGLTVLLALGLAPSASASQQAEDAARSDRASGLEAIRLLGEALRERAALPGFALAVGEGERIVLSEAFGLADLESRAPATPLTRWRIGSVSKGLTAAGAALLAERGRLDLDAPVEELLPSWGDRVAGEATARQLAGHLGGIRHYREGEGISHLHYDDVVRALELFAQDSVVAPPGREYSYSTYGYTLLSALMQGAAGEPFLAWIGREVFEPLGMRRTGPDLANRVVPERASFYEIRGGQMVPAPFTDNSYKWAGGGLLSTPEDLVRFGIGLLRGDLLRPDGVETLFASQRTDAGEETGYGMGFRPRLDGRGRRVVHHGGSSEGGRAFLLLYPEEGVVVAMAANRATAPLFEEEAQSVAHFILDHGPGGDGAIDRELAGAWSIDGSLGDGRVEGSLRLYARGRMRGILEWNVDERRPIEVVAVDRHGDRLLLFGAGPHGAMTMELEEAGGGWDGRWEYLGREGEIRLAGDGADASATCSPAGDGPAEDGRTDEARRVLRRLEPKVRFTNGRLPPMGLADRMGRYEVPGVAVAMIEGGELAWTCVAGVKRSGDSDPVTRETLFHVKSVSKPVAAVAALLLVESGRIGLDDPLDRHLRSYRVPDNGHTRQAEPTLRHLLSHSAGFTRSGVDSYRPGEPLPTLIQSLYGRPPADVDSLEIDFTPGTRSRYSGGGYGVLQALIQDVTGREFREVVDSLVFSPLGMEHSVFPQPLSERLEPFSADGHDFEGAVLPGGHETLPIMAAGGLWSTAPDLARFVIAVGEAWRGGDTLLLDTGLAREMLTRQPGGRGLGFEVEEATGSLLFHHGGSGDGFKALIVGLPEEGSGTVILANGDGAGPLRYEILRAVAREYDWPAFRDSAAYELSRDVTPADLTRLEGTYIWNSGIPTVVAVREGALYARFDEGAWTRLFPVSPSEFVSLEDARYRFLPGADESYTLELTDETGTYEAVPPERIREGTPEGWRVVAAGGPAAAEDIHFRHMGAGVHATSGPSALYFHPDSIGRVPYEVGATFMQIGEPGSEEGLGLMIAGVGTESGPPRHLLFRVRADGAYAIEVREGGGTTRRIRPWTRHEAVAPTPEEGGHSHNALRVRVGRDRMVFSVNETVVTTVASEELDIIEGAAGFFVGRGLDVHVDDVGVETTSPDEEPGG